MPNIYVPCPYDPCRAKYFGCRAVPRFWYQIKTESWRCGASSKSARGRGLEAPQEQQGVWGTSNTFCYSNYFACHAVPLFFRATMFRAVPIFSVPGRAINLRVRRSVPWQGFGNLGFNKLHRMKSLQIKIRVAQNGGKVWISRSKNPPGPIWGLFRQFFQGPKKTRTHIYLLLFSLVGQCALFTRFGPLLLSTLCGAIAIHEP